MKMPINVYYKELQVGVGSRRDPVYVSPAEVLAHVASEIARTAAQMTREGHVIIGVKVEKVFDKKVGDMKYEFHLSRE